MSIIEFWIPNFIVGLFIFQNRTYCLINVAGLASEQKYTNSQINNGLWFGRCRWDIDK